MQLGTSLNRVQMGSINGGLNQKAIICQYTLVWDCETQCPRECQCVDYVCFS
ncbi:hypothetical protein LX64_00849 [Chitinophaga skermanii]|uniref:Uncharacterized protein n=1 Tax=Chitinophaga skermanii TaxID=331697 RepID=A0A327QX53_9BACT|nr:hypothetical protein LX64_00849 [Chitinophaga skermanii]